MERQTLWAQQNGLSRPQMGEDERRLDAIGAEAGHDPVAARQMLEIYRQDRALAKPVPTDQSR